MGEDAGKSVNVIIKPWYQSKTIRVAALFFLGGGLDLLAKILLEEGVLTGQADIVAMVSGFLMYFLRKITTQPVA